MTNKNKVLVTGADGFIGSHLTEFLVNNDERTIDAKPSSFSQIGLFMIYNIVYNVIKDNSKVLMRNLTDNIICEIEKDARQYFYKSILAIYPRPTKKGYSDEYES